MKIKPSTVRRGQLTLTLAWLALVVPSLTVWRESVPWLVFMSVWANVAAHASGWVAGRAEEASG